MHLFGLSGFEWFFHRAANLDVDKNDFRRFDDFLSGKLQDLLLRAVENAAANGHDAVQPQDLPITEGLQESIDAFTTLGETVSRDAVLEVVSRGTPLDLPLAEETQALLPGIVGGIGVALVRSFRIVDEKLKTPQATHWDRVTRIFDQLL
ncbi:DUF1931 family protein [Leifsonia sp. F6_8S_P_1B]|uniref:DUF1931 family protein n=1 Tax=Leifsonia williamsii TaxID=3035919 RepID=A0ABT8KFG6_9MICO|nr:DUF1931 family protein [Leifsonia williamsii]MDN4615541.1 DUF1931 family protein [Leifsonia williamsii]